MREAIVALTDEELERLGFGTLITQVRHAGVRDVRMLEDDGYTCVPEVTVERRLDPDVLDRLECIDRWELVADTGPGYVYLFELTAVGLSPEVTAEYEDMLGTCSLNVDERGLLLSFVGSQEAIREIIRQYQAAGTSPELQRLTEYTGGSEAVDALTDRQLEVIRTALTLGFYEIPRAASTEEIATELGLDTSTVSEHLQRAERNLLTQQLVG